MTLRQARCAFSVCVAELVLYAVSLGHEVALDEGTERLTEKDPTSDHMLNSLHHVGLAQDVLLYINGVYANKTEAYAPLGEYWENLGKTKNLPLAWGGRFNDGNHFSMAWAGRK